MTTLYLSVRPNPRPDKKKFVSPTTFCRVEMCHQDSVIRDIKLGQKRA